jgi:hypothetical protein
VKAHLKRLKHYVGYKFSGQPAIQVIDFRRTFKEADNLNGISEGVLVVILPYFLEGRAKTGIYSRLKQVPSSTPRYQATVQWLHQSFATEPVIAASYQKVFTAKQSVDKDEKSFAGRLNELAAEALSVLKEDSLISAYVDGLLPFTSNMVRSQITTTMTFAEVQILSEQVGEAGKSLSAMSRATMKVNIPGILPLLPKYAVTASTEYTAEKGISFRDQRPMLVVTADLQSAELRCQSECGFHSPRSAYSDNVCISTH